MRTTVDLPDDLLREAEAEAARRGVAVRDLLQEGLRAILQQSQAAKPTIQLEDPPWFGQLRGYAANAGGRHDLAAIRASIERERKA